jgi:hypothetical protein
MAQARPLDLGAGVHDDVDPHRAGPGRRGLVDHTELHPDGVDPQPLTLLDAWSTTAPTCEELTKQSTTLMSVSGMSASEA